jgi:hypothetical protein
MGTRLQLFGSSGEDSGDEDGNEFSRHQRQFQGRGGYYDWYMSRARRDMIGEVNGDDDDDNDGRPEVDSD